MKKNPNRLPASLEEAEAAHKDGVSEGNLEGMLVYLSSLRDKEGYGSKRLWRVWQKVCEVCDLLAAEVLITPELAKELDRLTIDPVCPMMYHPDKIYTPPEIPVTQAKVTKSYKEGRRAGRQFATLVFLIVMHRCEKFGPVRIRRVYREAQETWDSLDRGYIKACDLQQTLFEESRIKVG